MLKFVPVIIYSAISLAIFQGSFFLLFELGMDPATKKDEKTKRDTLTMIGLGIGETLGGIMNGKLQDKLGSRKVCYLYVVEVIAAYGMLISYTSFNRWNMWYALAMNFFWGIQDSGVNNFIWSVAGFEFENESRPFAIFFFL
jgi:predicted MFS family arabinose efflux permease